MISVEDMIKAEFKKDVTIYFTDGDIEEHTTTEDYVGPEEDYEEPELCYGKRYFASQSDIEKIVIHEE